MGNCCGKSSSNTRVQPSAPPAPRPTPQPIPQPIVQQRPQPVPEPVKAPVETVTAAVEAETPVRAAISDPRLARIEAINATDPSPFLHDRCAVAAGAQLVRPCFEHGLAYLIQKEDAWYVYNDTPFYTMDMDCRFGPESVLQPGPTVSLTQTEDGWHTARVVVAPLQTELLVSGHVNGYTCALTARLATADGDDTAAQTTAAELAAVRGLVANDEGASGGGAKAAEEESAEQLLRQCAQQHIAFVDLDFPPTATSLHRNGIDGRQLPPTLVMRRPRHYLTAPQAAQVALFTGPLVPHAVRQGYLGDSWFASALTVLAEREHAVRDVFSLVRPDETDLGAYRVVLNKGGWWRTVLVDDYLPTCGGQPVFARSADDPCELWVSLLQKAYAKVHGSYAAITGGDTLQALTDLTGCPGTRFNAAWATAAEDGSAALALAARLQHYRAENYTVVLGTPSENAASYLAARRARDPSTFAARYAAAGLHAGRSYHLEAVRLGHTADDTWLQLRVPCKQPSSTHTTTARTATDASTLPDTAPWIAAAGDRWTSEDPSGAVGFDTALQQQRAEGLQWVTLRDAFDYFDGGAVLYTVHNAVDYRVRGVFDAATPSVALQLRVTALAPEPIELTLVLSQQDKRGVVPSSPQGVYAPIMLSVARCEDGAEYTVVCNSSDDATSPCTAHHFAVAREVALRFCFQPGATYVVVPRIHPQGLCEGYARPFTLGLVSAQPLEDKLSVQFCRLRAESNVLHNVATFAASDMHPTVAQHQRYCRGLRPVVAFSYGLTPEPPAQPEYTATGTLKDKLPSSAAHSEGAISDTEESNTQAIFQTNRAGDGAALEGVTQPTLITAVPPSSAEALTITHTDTA